MRRWASLLVGVCGLCVGLVAVGRAQQKPTFVGGVSIVTVDVTVLDRDGRPVPGLTADDFEIKLDGAVRPVRALSYESFAERVHEGGAAAPTAATPREVTNAVREPDPRVFVVLIDDLSIDPSRGKAMFFAASRFIDGLQPTDVVGMTTTSGLVTVNPTRDHAAVAAAVRHAAGAFIDPRSRPIAGTRDARTGDPIDTVVGLQESLEVASGNAVIEKQIVRRDCFGNGAMTEEQLATSQCAEFVERQVRLVGGVARGQVDAQMRSYLNVLAAMRPADGLKSLVLISDGIAMATRDQRTWFESIAKAAAAAGVQVSMLAQEPDMVNLGDRASAFGETRRDDGLAMMSGIQTVADLTGGRFYRVIGSPDPSFARVMMAASGVYHLGVESAGSAPGRDVRVNAVVKRTGLTVHANHHAATPAPVAAVPTRDQLQAGVLRGALSYEVPLTLATVVRRGSSADAVDIGANVEVPSGVRGPLTVMFGLLDASGKVKTGRATVTAPADGSNYRVSLALPVDTGRYQLRFAVADADGHVGSLGMGVRAEFARLGPFLSSDILTSWNIVGGRPQFLALEAVPPTATTLRSFLELYPSGTAPMPDDVRVEWQLFADGAQPIADESVRPARAADRLTASEPFALAALRPGIYEVRATVFVNGTAVGSVSTTVRKLASADGRTFWTPSACRGLCGPN